MLLLRRNVASNTVSSETCLWPKSPVWCQCGTGKPETSWAEHLSRWHCFHSRPLSRQTNKLGYRSAKTCRGSLMAKIQWEKFKILARECKRLLRAAWGQCASLGWGQELCNGVVWEQYEAPTSPLACRFPCNCKQRWLQVCCQSLGLFKK